VIIAPLERATATELMDDPAGDPIMLERTLAQFPLVNRILTRMRALIDTFILRDMEQTAESHGETTGAPTAKQPGSRENPFRVLDVGAGACDIPLWMAGEAKRRGISLHITCLDHDPRVVDYARRIVGDHPALSVAEGSVLNLDGNDRFDYIMGNHLLHHLSDGEIDRFLDVTHRLCRRRLLVNDLIRSRWSLVGYHLFASVFFRNSFAREDGKLSIRRGFLADELERFLQRSAWNGTGNLSWSVGRTIPGRVFLVAEKARPARVTGASHGSPSRRAGRALRRGPFCVGPAGRNRVSRKASL
jgi:SAM-dependent methyltransferase